MVRRLQELLQIARDQLGACEGAAGADRLRGEIEAAEELSAPGGTAGHLIGLWKELNAMLVGRVQSIAKDRTELSE